jgi:hypothetical protein
VCALCLSCRAKLVINIGLLLRIRLAPPPEYNEINAGTHVCAILSGRPLVAPRWTLLLG